MGTTQRKHTPHNDKNFSLPETEEDLLSREDRQMFMELGFTASTNFLPWEAHALFGQLMLAEPAEAYARIGLSYCKIMGGQFHDAHQLLDQQSVSSSALKDYAVALRGLAFHLEKKFKERDELFNSHENSLQENSAALGFFQVLLTLQP